MSAGQVQAAPGRRVLSSKDWGDGMRAYRYRSLDKEYWAIARDEPLGRGIIEDRWRGLMERDNDPTKLQMRLDAILHDLVERLTRRDLGDPIVEPDGQSVEGLDIVMDVDGLQGVIHEWLVERASRREVAL